MLFLFWLSDYAEEGETVFDGENSQQAEEMQEEGEDAGELSLH